MADDNTIRSYRASDAEGRGDAAFDQSDYQRDGDPLAELARMIGQSDPFAEFGRNQPRTEGQAQVRTSKRPDWRLSTTEQRPAPASLSSGMTSADFMSREPFDRAVAEERQQQEPGHPAEPSDRYGAPFGNHWEGADETHAAHEQTAAEPGPTDPYDYGDAPPVAAEEQAYDDAPRRRKSGGLVTAVVLIGCAMLGTAAAYGYRTYSTARAIQSPPVIVAEKTPTKVVPSPSDAASGKSIQDRVGESSGNERIVSREEQPVELNAPAASSPRVVLPSPVLPPAGDPTASAANPSTFNSSSSGAAPANPAAPSAPAPTAAAPATPSTPAANPSAGSKRVRTVTIRPDGTDIESRSMGGTPGSTSALPHATRSPSAGRGPLSLDPQANGEMASAPPARTRTASVPPSTGASQNSSATTGGYVVQVASQRSEAAANASLRSIQSKFSNQLHGRHVMVKRADLGSKGVYYRTMVGPFASAEDAGQFCSGLKAAGGNCIIQKN